MQYYIYPNISNLQGCVATTGFFDGVHLGHRAVLQRVIELAQIEKKPSCVITFWPHPRIVLQKDVDQLKLLSTLNEKQQLITNLGIDYLVVIPFTLDLSHLTAGQFFHKYLIDGIGVSQLIIGYDHHFGQGGIANFAQIEQLGEQAGIAVEQVEANSSNGITISSSKIRMALQNGDVALCNQLLGYDYTFSGVVIHGRKIGRKIGFPTANIQSDEPLKLLPKDGIYAVEAIFENIRYKGMLSIGFRPTIDDEHQRTVEVNIFDFNQSIYGENITICFIARLRDEYKFNSIEELRQQLVQDKINALSVLE